MEERRCRVVGRPTELDSFDDVAMEPGLRTAE